MTEEQKIDALQRILQGANVAQVNLGDGYQTFTLRNDNDTPRYDNNAGGNDTLIRFVFDDGERQKVVNGLQACEDTGQVAAFARKLWVEEIVEYEVLRSVEFHRAIIPLLKFDTSENALKQAIAKQVKE